MNQSSAKSATSILELAQKESRLDVLESFRPEYIDLCLAKNSGNAEKAWKALLISFETFDILKVHEFRMSPSFFVHVLQSTKMTVSGIDWRGRPILWFRAFENMYKVPAKSADGSAYIRAIAWATQILILKSASNPGKGGLIFLDDSHRKHLDFNIELVKEACRIVANLDPLDTSELVLFGANLFHRTVWNLLKQTGMAFTRNISYSAAKNDVRKAVQNHDDIPEWWFDDGRRESNELGMSQVWEWQRCLERGNNFVTAKEIFNPPTPWENALHNDFQNSNTKESGMNLDRLSTIPEEEETAPSSSERFAVANARRILVSAKRCILQQ